MKTAAQVQQEFQADFQALLDKYKAEMSVLEKECMGGFSSYVAGVEFDIPPIYNEDYGVVQEAATINVGTWARFSSS